MHWAHSVADRFPDGQLYLNLRGFDPAGAVMAPAEAIRRVLDALDVPAARIPTELGAQVDLYRSLLAGRRVLVILDNVRDAEHARPLLPGSPGCLVIVTSRHQLTGLVVTEGAHPVPLGLLTIEEAREMVAGRLGRARVTAEPEAVDAIIARCVHLPLALAIAAARALTHPALPLSTLAAELCDSAGALDTLSADEPVTDLRAVFSWSYRALTPAAAELFRLLGLHPGPDISASAAASLVGVASALVRPLLAELRTAHLLAEDTPGRYTLHELLRSYAMELAHRLDGEDHRRASSRRMLDHSLHTADAAALLLDNQRERADLGSVEPAVTCEILADDGAADAWFTTEHHVLVAAVHRAATDGLHTRAWQLASVLARFLDNRGHWRDWIAVELDALDAARTLGDRPAQARTHRVLARGYAQLGAYADADTHYREALAIYDALGDRSGHAATHFGLSWACQLRKLYPEALEHAGFALAGYRAADHHTGYARSLNLIGWCHALLGDHRQALLHCEQALALTREQGDRYGQAATLDSIGYAHHHLGDHDLAISCYREALTLYRQAGDRYNAADVLDHLGNTYAAAGDPDAAADAWREAVTILDRLDHPEADRIRTKL